MNAYVIITGIKVGPMTLSEALKDSKVFEKYGFKVKIEKIKEE